MKKLRRKGIADVEAANAFLEAEYWADHNRRFAQAPASVEDFHLASPRRVSLDQVFRLEETRTVSNDWVVRYDNRLLQLERQSGRPPARSTVLVYEAVDGRLEIRYRDRVMRWTEVQPLTQSDTGVSQPACRRPRREALRIKPRLPCADHPWRRGAIEQRRIDRQLAADRKGYAAVNP